MKINVATDKPTVCKILDAATPLFAMKGVAAVSVKEVAEAAGVNIALISYYFGGKDNLYELVLEKQLAILGDALVYIQQEETCPVAKIRRLARTIVASHTANPYIDRLFYSEVTNPTKCFDSVVKKAAIQLHQFLRQCIEDAMTSKQFRVDLAPDFAAISLMKILNLSFITLLAEEVLIKHLDSIEYYSEQALDIYLRGVSNA